MSILHYYHVEKKSLHYQRPLPNLQTLKIAILCLLTAALLAYAAWPWK